MMYSCALWGDEEGGVRGDIDPVPASESPSSSTGTLVYEPSGNAGALESAQQRKIAHVLRQLHLRPGGKLLEFGSGWGAMAISAARDYDVEVDTLTLSIEQKRLAEERIREAGLESRIRVHLMDYREVPAEWNGTFDAFVSIEMIEVGTILFTSS
jgi:cyclopropane-fatty-acyl-phospholipid synthase